MIPMETKRQLAGGGCPSLCNFQSFPVSASPAPVYVYMGVFYSIKLKAPQKYKGYHNQVIAYSNYRPRLTETQTGTPRQLSFCLAGDGRYMVELVGNKLLARFAFM